VIQLPRNPKLSLSICLIPLATCQVSAIAGGVLCNWRAIISSIQPSESNESRVLIDGDYAYITDGQGMNLLVYDVSDPSNPEQVSTFSNSVRFTDLVIDGSTVYLTAGDSGLAVVDVTDPSSPSLLGEIDTPGYAITLETESGFVYIADESSVQIIDVLDPTNPKFAASYPINRECYEVEIENGILLADDTDIDGNRNYGFYAIDVTNPVNPSTLGSYVYNIDFDADSTQMTVREGTLFLTNSAFGLQFFDINDPTQISLISTYKPFVDGEPEVFQEPLGFKLSGSTMYINYGIQVSTRNN
jgi:hypothetical protein